MAAGVLLGEAVRFTPAMGWLERACRQRPSVSIALSTLFGAVSPLCTYGTVPVVLSLVRSGVPVAPLAAFLATSSLINPQLLAITWGGLGHRIALAQLAGVIGFGLLVGGVLRVLPARFSVKPLLLSAPEREPRGPRPFTFGGFTRSALKSLEFVGFYLLLGILLGAAIEVAVPGHWFLRAFGRRGWLEILVAALLGLPLYACGGAVVPLLAALLEEGMNPGAALAFLLAGPATRVTPLLALATVARGRFMAAYVMSIITYAVVAGVLFGSLSGGPPPMTGDGDQDMMGIIAIPDEHGSAEGNWQCLAVNRRSDVRLTMPWSSRSVGAGAPFWSWGSSP